MAKTIQNLIGELDKGRSIRDLMEEEIELTKAEQIYLRFYIKIELFKFYIKPILYGLAIISGPILVYFAQ